MQMSIINKSFVLIKVNIHIQELQNKPRCLILEALDVFNIQFLYHWYRGLTHSHLKKVILLIDSTPYSMLSFIDNVERKQIDTKGNWLSFFSIQFGHYLEKMGLNFPT